LTFFVFLHLVDDQGVWADRDNPVLMQVPHVDKAAAARLVALGSDKADGEGLEPVETVFDLAAMDAALRQRLLGLPSAKLADVASFCNRFPNIDVSYELRVRSPRFPCMFDVHIRCPALNVLLQLASSGSAVPPGGDVSLGVVLERDAGTEGMTEGAGIGAVHAPLFPRPKAEGWWLVVGEPRSNTILAIKRVTLAQRADLQASSYVLRVAS
jgi:pre-mRNA-splicing helicase BRR2